MVQNHLPHDHGQTIEQARNFHHMIEWLVKIACPSQVEKQKGTPLKKKNPKLSLKNFKRFQTAPSP